MAGIKTSVTSPAGTVMSFPGRIPAPEAVEAARKEMNRTISEAQLHLEEIDNWRVVAHRGYQRVKTFEENGGE